MIYEYNDNLKSYLEIYKLQGKVTLGREKVKEFQGVDEQGVT